MKVLKVCARASLTSLCDASTLPSDASVSQEPPLPLHPHLTLQVMLLWDLKEEISQFILNDSFTAWTLAVWSLCVPRLHHSVHR